VTKCEMANEEIKLRPKGPLTRPLLAARGKSSYSEPSSIANGVKLDVRRKGSKKSTQNTEGTDWNDHNRTTCSSLRSAAIRFFVCSIALPGSEDPGAESNGGEEGSELSDPEVLVPEPAFAYS